MTKKIVIFDYGFGNVRSAYRAFVKAGEDLDVSVELTSDYGKAMNCDGLVVPGVGAFNACMKGLRVAKGDEIIRARVAKGLPVFGICVGHQVFFEGSQEGEALERVECLDKEKTCTNENALSEEVPNKKARGDAQEPGLALLKGQVKHLDADVVPHMGWNTVKFAGEVPAEFRGLEDERFYFVHSYAVQ